MSGGSALRPRWPPQPNLAWHRTLWEIHIQIFSSETTGPIATKLWWNGPWVAPFQICVRWSRLLTKMATKLKIEKRGDEIKKNLLLWNYWANLNQTLLKWSLGCPLPKLCPTFQTSDQDGRHRDHQTQFWMRTTQWLFYQSLVPIEQLVPD
jgi:hypothetical protein